MNDQIDRIGVEQPSEDELEISELVSDQEEDNQIKEKKFLKKQKEKHE